MTARSHRPRTQPDEWVTVSEAARRIGCQRNTVYVWLAKGTRPDGTPLRSSVIAGKPVVRAEDCTRYESGG